MVLEGRDSVALKRRDIPKAVRIAADAFIDYPIPGGFIEEKNKRRRALREMFKIELRYSLKHSFVRTLPGDFCEFAVIRADTHIVRDKEYIPYASLSTLGLLFNVSGRELKKLEAAVSQIERTKACLELPLNTAELFILAVSPEHQGEGRAGRLMRPLLNEMEAQGISVLVLTNTEKNCNIYARLGFSVIEETYDARFNLTTFFMLRTAEGQSAES